MKAVAYGGTILVWIPVLFALVTGAVKTLMTGMLRVDYLIPAELFPMELLGAALLLWAAVKVRKHVNHAAYGLVVMVLSLAASQGAAVATGLASGMVEAVGWQFALVVGLIGIYIAAVIWECVLGVRLIKAYRHG